MTTWRLERVEAKSEDTQATVIDVDAPSKPYSQMIFGDFIEHFHRQVYSGLYEPM